MLSYDIAVGEVIRVKLNYADTPNDGGDADSGFLKGRTLITSTWAGEAALSLLLGASTTTTTEIVVTLTASAKAGRQYNLRNFLELSTGEEYIYTVPVRVIAERYL